MLVEMRRADVWYFTAFRLICTAVKVGRRTAVCVSFCLLADRDVFDILHYCTVPGRFSLLWRSVAPKGMILGVLDIPDTYYERW